MDRPAKDNSIVDVLKLLLEKWYSREDGPRLLATFLRRPGDPPGMAIRWLVGPLSEQGSPVQLGDFPFLGSQPKEQDWKLNAWQNDRLQTFSKAKLSHPARKAWCEISQRPGNS
jgi:hypothetical protein